MFNFHLVTLVHLLWMLDFYERTPLSPKPAPPVQPSSTGLLSGFASLAPFLDNGLSEIDKGNAKDILNTASALAKELDLRTTKHRVEAFEMKLRFDMKGEEYKNEIKVLGEALKYDLQDCYFYHYPRAKAEVMIQSYSTWKAIFEAFPDVKPEANAAIDLYGLNHNTGSVFHSMRVAEHGLRAIAKERRVRLPRNKPVDWATWQEIIKELNDEATKIGQKASAGAAKDDALSFYSGAISDLNAFKDEYRNQVMHLRKDYDERQALRALTKVQGFMERLSEKMNQSHSRIKWGLKFKSP